MQYQFCFIEFTMKYMSIMHRLVSIVVALFSINLVKASQIWLRTNLIWYVNENGGSVDETDMICKWKWREHWWNVKKKLLQITSRSCQNKGQRHHVHGGRSKIWNAYVMLPNGEKLPSSYQPDFVLSTTIDILFANFVSPAVWNE